MAEPKPDSDADAILLQPVFESGARLYLVVAILLAIIAWALFAWVLQMREGLGITGLNRPVMWGFYITNFVFFIGISHAGTLISAILRLCNAEWRRAITRSAEVITVLVLFIGMSNIVLDIGRPDRVMYVLKFGHLRSPLLWDVISVTTYLTGSTIYLYLPLIPDIALIRDRTTKRRWLYRLLALGWQGTERQHRWLERGIAVMAILVIPIAVSVHTVVSWVFGMTIQPMWHSTIFGPYFVVGAIFSGIAALIIAMAILRWAYHLEDYIRPVHFNNLAILLLVMTLLWFYFTFAEHLTRPHGGLLCEGDWTIRTLFLDHGRVLFRHPAAVACSAPHRGRRHHRVVGGAHRHVVGTVHHRRAHVGQPPTAVRPRLLSSDVGRVFPDGWLLCRLHPLVCGVFQVVSHRLGLGNPGGPQEGV
jgi:Ni/Fe-hydrogenase subunit HybB-like protein